MPTKKPQKSVNLDIPEHEIANKIAAIITKRNRQLTGNPDLVATNMKEAIKLSLHAMLQHLEAIEAGGAPQPVVAATTAPKMPLPAPDDRQKLSTALPQVT